MALSNIGREPRREIIESLAGILAVVAWVVVSFLVARHFDPYYAPAKDDYSPPWWVTVSFFTFMASILIPLASIVFLYLTHEVGEMVCGWMTALGFDPRPKQRY